MLSTVCGLVPVAVRGSRVGSWRTTLIRTIALLVALTTSAAGALTMGAQAAPGQSTTFAIVGIDSPRLPVAGQAWPFETELLAGYEPVAGAAVTLEIRPAGRTRFLPVVTVRTDDQGAALARVGLIRNTKFRWRFPGTAGFEPTVSRAFTIFVAPKVTTRASSLAVRPGQQFAATGWTFPIAPGTPVDLVLGRYQAGIGPAFEQRTLATTRTRRDGTFRLPWRFNGVGVKRLFVRVHSTTRSSVGYSNYLIVHVDR